MFGAIEVKRKEKTVNVTCSFMPIDFRPGFTSFYLSTQAWSVALKKKCMNEKKCRCQALRRKVADGTSEVEMFPNFEP